MHSDNKNTCQKAVSNLQLLALPCSVGSFLSHHTYLQLAQENNIKGQDTGAAAHLTGSFSSAVSIQGAGQHLPACFTMLAQQGYELFPALAPHYLPQAVSPPCEGLLALCSMWALE